MLRYFLAANSLRLASFNGVTRAAYRNLANLVGGRRRRREIRSGYIQRANQNLCFVEQQGGIADGMRVLEIGTGWVHWEALFFRLFYDVELVLFDVWDNRQFEGFINYVRQLRIRLRAEVDRPSEQIDRAEAMLDRISQCTSFEQFYDLVGASYVIEPGGSMGAIADQSIDLAMSSDVLEMVDARALPDLVGHLFRVLKPGSLTAHQIVFGDHLRIYDRTVHPKQYMAFTEGQWLRWFENEVQYTNHWQHCDFVELFKSQGFAFSTDAIVETCDSSTLALAPKFATYDRRDLDACVTRLGMIKPASPRG